jgi:hypothetical protein
MLFNFYLTLSYFQILDGLPSPHSPQEHRSSAHWSAGILGLATTAGDVAQLTTIRTSGGGAFWDKASGTWEPSSPGHTQ